MEEAFLRFEIEIMKLSDFEDVVYGTLMIRQICTGSDPDVVHVDPDRCTQRLMFEDDVTVNVVHHRLKRCWRVGESEVHDSRFEKSVSGFKCCFLFISFVNAYVVVPPSNIKFRVNVCVAEVADEIRDQGKGVLILNSKGVDLSIVLYWS